MHFLLFYTYPKSVWEWEKERVGEKKERKKRQKERKKEREGGRKRRDRKREREREREKRERERVFMPLIGQKEEGLYKPKPSTHAGCDTRTILWSLSFEFRVYLLLDWLPLQS